MANHTDEQTIEAIAALRRLRFSGPEIAEILDRPVSTVSGILTRIGMGKLGRLGLGVCRPHRLEPRTGGASVVDGFVQAPLMEAQA